MLLVPLYLFIGAFFFTNPFMALVGVAFLSLFIYTRSYLIRMAKTLEIETHIEGENAYVDEDLHISQIIGSEGSLFLTLEPGDDMKIVGEGMIKKKIEGKKLVEYSLKPSTPGKTEVGAFTGTLYDPMEFFKLDMEHPHKKRVIVYPSKEAIRHAKAYAHRVHLEELVEDIQRFNTTSGELEEIREYQPGDRLRDMHWQSISKLGKLMTKVYEKMALLECCIFLDMSPSMRRGDRKINHATFITLELLKELELSGHGIGLTVYDHRDVIFHQRPEHKRTAFPRIYQAMSDLLPPREAVEYLNQRYDKEITTQALRDAETQFAERVSRLRHGTASPGTGGLVGAVREIKKQGNKRSLVIFITDMETEPGLIIKSTEKLRALNHVVWVVILFSPWYDVDVVTKENLERAYNDYLNIEKIRVKLHRGGARVFEVYPGKEGLRILEEGR